MTETPPAPAAIERSLPPAAARARSVAAREDATVCVAGATYARPLAHATTADGRVYVVLPDDSPVTAQSLTAARGELPGMLVVTDICPVGVPDRVRGTVWLTGWLTPVPPADVHAARLAMAAVRPTQWLLDIGESARLLELRLHDVILSDCTGTSDVPAAEFLAAEPDLLLREEATALRHLDVAHRDILDALAGLPCGQCVVRPVALDCHGLSLRIAEHGRYRDVRLDFAQPLRHVTDLPAAMKSLRG